MRRLGRGGSMMAGWAGREAGREVGLAGFVDLFWSVGRLVGCVAWLACCSMRASCFFILPSASWIGCVASGCLVCPR